MILLTASISVQSCKRIVPASVFKYQFQIIGLMPSQPKDGIMYKMSRQRFVGKKMAPANTSNKKALKRTISRDLTISLVGVVTLAFVVIIALNWWMLARQAKLQHQEKADKYMAFLQDALQLLLSNAVTLLAVIVGLVCVTGLLLQVFLRTPLDELHRALAEKVPFHIAIVDMLMPEMV